MSDKLVPIVRLNLEIIRGVEGDCVSLNDFRIAGPKPWGGGQVIKKFSVMSDKLQKCIDKAIEAERELNQ